LYFYLLPTDGSYLHLPSAAIGPQHPRRIK
jgi:hypothetical protein